LKRLLSACPVHAQILPAADAECDSFEKGIELMSSRASRPAKNDPRKYAIASEPSPAHDHASTIVFSRQDFRRARREFRAGMWSISASSD